MSNILRVDILTPYEYCKKYHSGNKTDMARAFGISRQSVYDREKLGYLIIDGEFYRPLKKRPPTVAPIIKLTDNNNHL